MSAFRGIETMLAIIAAANSGEGLSAQVTARLARTVTATLAARREQRGALEENLGLAPDEGWLIIAKYRIRRSVDLQDAPGLSIRARSRYWEDRLCNYLSSGAFRRDQDGDGWPTGERGKLFRLALASGGRMPSLTTLRDWVAESVGGQLPPLPTGHFHSEDVSVANCETPDEHHRETARPEEGG